jgi:NADH-quinone oxidoreductase subunit I
MSCQICVEVCPFDAIKMDQVFEIAATDRFTGLLLNREELAKPNSYYHQIHPTRPPRWTAASPPNARPPRKSQGRRRRQGRRPPEAAPPQPPAAPARRPQSPPPAA